MLKKPPSSKTVTFRAVKDGCLDKLVSKLELFAFLSHMLSFLASELETLIRNITSRFIKPEVVKVCNTFTELAKFDTKLEQNHLSLRRLTLNLRPEELFRNSCTQVAKHKGRKLNFSVLSTISGCRVGKCD